MDQMLRDDPDMNEIQMSKEEIAFHIEHLGYMVDEFIQFSEERYQFGETPEKLQEMILDDLLKKGTESDFYIVALEWKEYADSAFEIVWEFWEKFSYICHSEAEEYLRQHMMDLQMPPKERENHQIVKDELDKMRQPRNTCRNKTDEKIIPIPDGSTQLHAEPGQIEPVKPAAQSRTTKTISTQKRN